MQGWGSDERLVGVEGWGGPQSERRGWCHARVRQRLAARWCGGMGVSAVGADGLVPCRAGAAMGGVLVG